MRFQEIRSASPGTSSRADGTGIENCGARGITGLGSIELSPENQRLLESVSEKANGQAVWRTRKTVEARELLALGQRAPGRLRIQHLDADEALHAVIELKTPVPVRAPNGDGIAIASGALLGLTYREEAILRPLPGYVFVQILAPRPVFHAQVRPDAIQPICLGATLPAGVRCRELVMMVFGALSMQTVMLDEMDPAGVLNAEAARWWQRNTERIPLTTEPFLGHTPAAEKEGRP